MSSSVAARKQSYVNWWPFISVLDARFSVWEMVLGVGSTRLAFGLVNSEWRMDEAFLGDNGLIVLRMSVITLLHSVIVCDVT